MIAGAPLEAPAAWAYSSVVEHCVDIAGVASSILATPTIFPLISQHEPTNGSQRSLRNGNDSNVSRPALAFLFLVIKRAERIDYADGVKRAHHVSFIINKPNRQFGLEPCGDAADRNARSRCLHIS
jgi:hypothetical protein